MNIQSTKPLSLPPLPKVPAKGTGTVVTEPIDYVAPKTVETRLGSIPKNYESGTGSSRSTREVLFQTGEKEAANPRGRSVDVWRPQPQFDASGEVIMEQVSQPLTVKYRHPAAEAAVKGAVGAGIVGFLGLWVGTVTSILTGRPEPLLIGGLGGAAVGGLVGGVSAYRDAASDRVRLEWQKTDIAEHELKGYSYRVDEDRDCTGFGDDRKCDTDYEHIYRPIIAETKHGEYYKPTVVHYKET